MTKADISSVSPFFVERDGAAALSFYCDQLGFAVTCQEPADEPFFGIVCRGGAMIVLKSVGVAPLPNYKRELAARWDGYLYVPDPDALAAEFIAQRQVFRKYSGSRCAGGSSCQSSQRRRPCAAPHVLFAFGDARRRGEGHPGAGGTPRPVNDSAIHARQSGCSRKRHSAARLSCVSHAPGRQWGNGERRSLITPINKGEIWLRNSQPPLLAAVERSGVSFRIARLNPRQAPPSASMSRHGDKSSAVTRASWASSSAMPISWVTRAMAAHLSCC
jgi:hypothetical protein